MSWSPVARLSSNPVRHECKNIRHEAGDLFRATPLQYEVRGLNMKLLI